MTDLYLFSKQSFFLLDIAKSPRHSAGTVSLAMTTVASRAV